MPLVTPRFSFPLGETGDDDFPGYGSCGIAVADLPGTPAGKEIVVATANGELVVFGHSNGVVNQTLFRAVEQGSIGTFNSIVVANLEPDTARRAAFGRPPRPGSGREPAQAAQSAWSRSAACPALPRIDWTEWTWWTEPTGHGR